MLKALIYQSTATRQSRLVAAFDARQAPAEAHVRNLGCAVSQQQYVVGLEVQVQHWSKRDT